jgi:hypothetical protein
MSGFHDGVYSQFEFTPRSAIFNFALIRWTARCLADGLAKVVSCVINAITLTLGHAAPWIGINADSIRPETGPRFTRKKG